MTRQIRDQVFVRSEIAEGAVVRDVALQRCRFDNCVLSLTGDPARMARVEKVRLTRCASINSAIGPCWLDDIVIDDLRTGDIQIVWGALLRHVTLTGKIGSVKLNTAIQAPDATPEQQAAFDALRERHYGAIDWALDISAARPLMLELAGIPARLVRRDPETQVVVSRGPIEAAGALDDLPGLDVGTRFALELLVRNGDAEKILVAPTGRAKRFYEPVLRSFDALRKAGIVTG